MELEKPIAIRRVYEYDEVIKYLEQKYGFDQYNVSNKTERHYDMWCDARGYTERKKDPEGKHRSSSQIWFQEYRNDPDGMDKDPPKENFWHWLLEYAGMDKVISGKPFVMPVGRTLDDYDTVVAPLLQQVLDKQHEQIVALIKQQITDPVVQKAALQDYPRRQAKLPEYVKKVLGYMREEFGESFKMRNKRER